MTENLFFPFGRKQRQSEIQRASEVASVIKESAKDGYAGRYRIKDSPLDNADNQDKLLLDRFFRRFRKKQSVSSPIDSDIETHIESFYKTFGELLPEGTKSLRKYIETNLRSVRGRALGIEFGGVGVNLFGGFTPGFFKKTVGVALADHRDQEAKDNGQTSGHEIIEGDIFDSGTYERLENELGGSKVDLIIERMAGGLESVPLEPYTVSKIINKWYKMINEGGIMMIQTPIAFDFIIKKWVQSIKANFSAVLDIKFRQGISDFGSYGSAFILIKLKGAPDNLPMLDPRTVVCIPKKISKKVEF